MCHFGAMNVLPFLYFLFFREYWNAHAPVVTMPSGDGRPTKQKESDFPNDHKQTCANNPNHSLQEYYMINTNFYVPKTLYFRVSLL